MVPIRSSLARAYEEVKGEPLSFRDNQRLVDVGFDSLDLLEAAVLIEKDLGVRLDPEDFVAVNTFGDLIRAIAQLMPDVSDRPI